MSYNYAQLYEQYREGDDTRENFSGGDTGGEEQDSETPSDAPSDKKEASETHSFPSTGDPKPTSMSWLNTKQSIPSVDWTDEETLKHLGLSSDTFKEKKNNAPLIQDHMNQVRSQADIFRWSKFSLQDQLTARKMGIRSYDPHILLHKRQQE